MASKAAEKLITDFKHRIEDGEGITHARKSLRILMREKPTDIEHHGLCFCVECV
jgi:hypothetical protein